MDEGFKPTEDKINSCLQFIHHNVQKLFHEQWSLRLGLLKNLNFGTWNLMIPTTEYNKIHYMNLL